MGIKIVHFVFLFPFIAFSFSEKQNKRNNEVLGESAINTFNYFDDQICLANFDVSEGSIIRTKDSLALGARYINVSELGDGKAKDDCLRLCCKTPHCNVITFEEKRSGSCYMFNCGSIDNFLCKFTDQAEFMSAILRKRMEPLVNVPLHVQNQNRHEAELSELRNSETEPHGAVGNSPTKSEPEEIPTAKEKASNFTFNLDKPENFNGGSRRCSRYQFECKSTGECIGIYNACDGISQCPDGSDEAAELNCPSVNGRPGIVKGAEARQIGSSKAEASSEGRVGINNGDSSSLTAKSSQIQIHHSQELHSAARPREFPPGSSPLLPPPRGMGNNYVPANAVGKNGNTVAEISAQPNSNNIFSHKDGGVMEDSYGNQLQQQRQNNPYNYWKSYDYGIGETPGLAYNSQTQSLQQQGRNPPFYNSIPGGSAGNPINQPINYGNGFKFPAYGDIPPVPFSPNNQIFSPIVQQQLYDNVPNNGVPKLNPVNQESPASIPSNAASQIQMNPSKTEMTTIKPVPPITLAHVTTTIVTTIPPQPQLKVNEKEMEGKILQILINKSSLPVTQLDAVNYRLSSESEIPSPGAGAVLAFVAGLAMSLAMVVILTCRLRKVRMSSRRRGKNRLDPDYLVDGMYL